MVGHALQARRRSDGHRRKSSMKLTIALLAGTAVVLGAAGCTRGVRSPFEHEITKRVTPEKPQFNIDGWTDTAGVHHEVVRGLARISGDSVEFHARPYWSQSSPESPTTKLVATLPRSEVAEVDVRRFSPLKTGILLVSPIVMFYVLLALDGDSLN